MTSREVQTRRLVAAQMLVFTTAIEASTLAAYGAPPLNPDHPIHSNPPPASISSTLFGGNLSLSLFNLGPTFIHLFSQHFQFNHTCAIHSIKIKILFQILSVKVELVNIEHIVRE